jgi:hypothetical protein
MRVRRIIVLLSLLSALVAFSCSPDSNALVSKAGESELSGAVESIGTAIPLPEYLPDGYQIQRVLPPENYRYDIGSVAGAKSLPSVTAIISDSPVEGYLDASSLGIVNGKSGLFGVAGENSLQLDIVYWQGYPFSWKSFWGVADAEVPAERELFAGASGYLNTVQFGAQEADRAWVMSWTLGNSNAPEFVLTAYASKHISEAELLTIAQSIKLKT